MSFNNSRTTDWKELTFIGVAPGPMSRKPMHLVVGFPEDEYTLGESIKLFTAYDRTRRFSLGSAEVVAIKECRIVDIDPLDYQRAWPAFNNQSQLLQVLRAKDPKKKITENTVIQLVQIAPRDHSLESLNEVLGRRPHIRPEPPRGERSKKQR